MTDELLGRPELARADQRRMRHIIEKAVRDCAATIDRSAVASGPTVQQQLGMAMAILDHLAFATIHAHARDEGRAGIMLEMHTANVGRLLADRYGMKVT